MAMLPQIIQTDPNLERRRQLAQAMMQQGQSSAPVGHWTQGANRIAQSLLGAYQGRQAEQEQAQQQQMGQEALQQAIGQFQSPSQPMMGGEPGDEVQFDLGPSAPTEGSSIQRFAQVLAQNPYTQQYGSQVQLQNALAQQQMAMSGRQKESQLSRQKELAEYKAQLAQQYPKPKTDFEKYLDTLTADKMQADIALKQEKARGSQLSRQAEIDNIQSAADSLQSLVTHPGFQNIYGSLQGTLPSIRQSSVDAEAIRTNVIEILALAARGQLKGQGQITDGETKMLRDAQSTLSNPRIGDEAAMTEAARVLGYLQSKGANLDPQVIGALTGQGQQMQGQPAPPEGYQLMEDAQGNRAYVGPNGEIQEL